MKLLIEIDEKDYNLAYDLVNGVNATTHQDRIYKTIVNGKPYNPTGDLISRSALKNELNHLGWTEENGFKNRFVLDDIIDNAPTVEVRDNFDLGYVQGLEDGRKEKSDHAL